MRKLLPEAHPRDHFFRFSVLSFQSPLSCLLCAASESALTLSFPLYCASSSLQEYREAHEKYREDQKLMATGKCSQEQYVDDHHRLTTLHADLATATRRWQQAATKLLTAAGPIALESWRAKALERNYRNLNQQVSPAVAARTEAPTPLLSPTPLDGPPTTPTVLAAPPPPLLPAR